jgi:hypothetical protein
LPVTSRSVLTISRALFGFVRKRLPEGRSSALRFALPDVATILMGGHRPLTAAANLRPSIEPRHMDIRENNRDVGAALKNFDGLVSVFRLYDFEAAGSNHINRIHADEKFVLDNQDYRSMVRLGIRQINVSPLHSSIADVIGSSSPT